MTNYALMVQVTLPAFNHILRMGEDRHFTFGVQIETDEC